ncbi:hypothetical protein PR048_005816 [Dryococelus australis]|uniref:Uncharacterized protein n=1 Tax=Dryococelus australis TaxID=614101 RepID=A0ABQ9IBE3_9NEOP|nr:hypothetical protein PR048_005816 [Dryococelus australis]
MLTSHVGPPGMSFLNDQVLDMECESENDDFNVIGKGADTSVLTVCLLATEDKYRRDSGYWHQIMSKAHIFRDLLFKLHPVIPLQEVVYMRQLTYNIFNIHNKGQNNGTFNTYHEGTAKKGVNDVAPFLLDYKCKTSSHRYQ